MATETDYSNKIENALMQWVVKAKKKTIGACPVAILAQGKSTGSNIPEHRQGDF